MYVTNERLARAKDLRNDRGQSICLVDASTGCDSVDVRVNVLAPNGELGPYHYHSNADNVYYILSGEATLRTAGGISSAGPGDAIHLLRGEPHAVGNLGVTELRLVEIKAPAGSDFILVDEEADQTENGSDGP